MKKISLLFLMLTFLLIPTCVNANAISWDDFVNEINTSLGGSFDFEQVLADSGLESGFKNKYNTCSSFVVLGDYGASASPNIYEPTKLYFIFGINDLGVIQGRYKADKTELRYYTVSAYFYTYDFVTSTLAYTNQNTNTIHLSSMIYPLSKYPAFSLDNFYSKEGAEYFADKIYVNPLGWNYEIQYTLTTSSWNPQGSVLWTVSTNDMDNSDYPWEDGNSGGSGSGDTYYNYDFGEYFQKPWISIDNVQGLVQNTATIPFKVMSQSGDEYYPFDKLKLDLRVYKVFTDENGKKTQSLFDTYKRYNGDYVDTNGYSSVSQNGKINVYSYDLRSKFDSNFIDTYLNTSGDNFDYAFQLILYSFWEDELSSTKLFFFNENNNLNSGTIPDDYYDNNWNGGGDFNFENMSFDSILNTAKNFLNSILSFFSVFPDWFNYLLAFGISIAVILRILGR